MKVFQGYEEAHKVVQPLVYAIGNFDGVHVGHESLLKQASLIATQNDIAFGVYTFWPHPRSVLRPQDSLPLITTREQKLERFAALGVPYVIEEPFTQAFSQISAEEFCNDIVVRHLRARCVVTGPNFHFGHKAAGDSKKMAIWLDALGVGHVLAEPVRVGDELCSSSRIRDLISAKGDVVSASHLLGRLFALVGHVVKGDGRGKQIGFPTANIEVPFSALIPAPGVYATTVRIGYTLLKAATNVGTRPTFSDSKAVVVETHILDFNEDIYDQKIEIMFERRIRDEMKFNNVAELVSQIAQDVRIVRT